VLELKLAGSNVWASAVLVGLFTKGIMHLNIATIGDKPIGLEAVALIFEVPFANAMALDHDRKLTRFLEPYEKKYTDAGQVINNVIAHIPDRLTLDEKYEIKLNIQEGENVHVVFQRCVKRFGEKNFKQMFPLD
jgi:hypothetical protein